LRETQRIRFQPFPPKAKGRQTHTGVPMLAAQMAMMLDFMGVR